MKSYFFVLCTVALTVYSQLAIKKGMVNVGAIPASIEGKLWFVIGQLLNPWILSALVSAFLSLIVWMFALSKLPLSHAYPFISLAFVFVLLLGHLLFNEPLTAAKILGVLFIMIGLAIGSQG